MEIKDSVKLENLSLGHLLGIEENENTYSLKIPEYQRVYCWEEKQVVRLLKDISQRSHETYHLGTIILHQQEKGIYHIVDGQQRLVTLSFILAELGCHHVGLLNEKFFSKDSESSIAYNKYLIANFLKNTNFKIEDLKNNVIFSVLIINSANLDLAYTFFSSENGKGKSLSDYDLLKSHHLRYIHIPQQAEHLASNWDDLIRDSDNDNTEKPLARTLGIHLFRLRKWMRKREWNEDQKRKVKDHFEAAPIIPNIPPFGEMFHFYETIQGGAHFFAYTEIFVQRFKDFRNLELYKELHQYLSYEKHWWYRDIIESITFAYYLKFGQQYLLKVLSMIIDMVSYHRYNNFRAYQISIFRYVNDTEMVLMLDQATSPTFFLAEMKAKLELMSVDKVLSGTRARYEWAISEIKKNLKINNDLEDGK